MKRYLRATELSGLAELEACGYDGLAFGAEFCHRRLPTLKEVTKARARCAELGIDFTLVLPLVREAAFDEVWGWLREAIKPGEEWISNDLGLLQRAADEGLENPVAAGRLLSRQRRGPRVGQMIADGGDAHALRGSMWDAPQSRFILEKLNIVRVELDALLQGIADPGLPDEILLSLCGPWIPVTLTPDCHWTPDGKTQLDCPRACAGRQPIRMENDEEATPLYSRGNAIFAKVEEGEVSSQALSVQADRLVWSPQIPG